MSQGVYRIGTSAGGLPFPRRGLRASAFAILAGSVIALVLPFLLLAVDAPYPSITQASRRLREGGDGMYLLLVFEVAAPIALGAMGLVLVRGRKLPAAALFAFAAVPYGNALASAFSATSEIGDVFHGESVGPDAKARILAQGMSETLANDTFGGYVAGIAAVLACIAASAAVATIDPRAAPAMRRSVTVAVSGGLWFVASVVLAVKSGERVGYVVPAVVAVMSVGAVLAARSVDVVRDWHDRAEASRAASALVVAALASLFAVVVLTRGVAASTTATFLAEYSRVADLDRSEGIRVLGELVTTTRASSLACVVLLVLGIATWCGVLLPVVRLGVSRPNILAFGAALLLALLTFTLSRARLRAPEETLPQPFVPPDIALPVVPAAYGATRSLGGGLGERLFLPRNGDRDPRASCKSGGYVALYADRATRFGLVRAHLPNASECKVTLSLGTIRSDAAELEARLGPYALLLNPISYIGARVDADGDESDAVLDVVSVPDALLINDRKVELPLTELVPDTLEVVRVHYYFRSSDTVEHVLHVILNVEDVYRRSLGDPSTRRGLDCIDCATTF